MSLNDKVQPEQESNIDKRTPNSEKKERLNNGIFHTYKISEDKIDFQIIPVIKGLGIFTSIVWLFSEVTEKPIWGFICFFFGLAITFLWTSIFEGFSSVIKLLRKISDK